MEQYILSLKKKYTEDLGTTASEYMDLAMSQFHRYRAAGSASKEIAIHTLSSAMELMLKCYIAEKNLGLIFTGIPTELKVLLTCPESIPPFFEWRKHLFGLRTEGDATICLEDSIACFYVFFPHLKQPFLPHLNHLLRWAPCAHNLLPSFSRYDFDRIGYVTMQIYQSLVADSSFSLLWYQPDDEDNAFMQNFAQERAERVEASVSHASMKAILPDSSSYKPSPGDWYRHATTCPVCGKSGALSGYTELAVTEDEEGKYTSLDFFAVDFRCPSCGLVLNDVEEMKLAKLSTLYDRSDELDYWFAGREYFTDWYTD